MSHSGRPIDRQSKRWPTRRTLQYGISGKLRAHQFGRRCGGTLSLIMCGTHCRRDTDHRSRSWKVNCISLPCRLPGGPLVGQDQTRSVSIIRYRLNTRRDDVEVRTIYITRATPRQVRAPTLPGKSRRMCPGCPL